MDNRKKAFALRTLRKGSLRWPPRTLAKNEGRKQFPISRTTKTGKTTTRDIWHYQCVKCPADKWHRDKDIQMDHTVPIVDPAIGFTNFDEFIDKLLVPVGEWQRLCIPHHLEKSLAEGEVRTGTRAENKKDDPKPTKQTKSRKKKEQP